MSFLTVKNNAQSALYSGITAAATSLTLLSGEGAKFPAANFHISIDDEILLCSSRTGDVLTVTRAQEGTAAAVHAISATVTLNITAAIIEELQAALSFKACKVKKTAHQSITDSAHNVLTWDAESFDTDAMHDNSTNNSRITVKTAGYYLVVANIQWQLNATGVRIVQLKQNGGLIDPFVVPANPSYTSWCTVVTLLSLSVDDYIEVSVWQNSGSAITVNSTYSYFLMVKLG